jgi:hypothetical protein
MEAMQNNADNSSVQRLKAAKQNILRQALLAVFVAVLAIVVVVTMTTAWYNNIVHTSGLMFQSAAWGFKGQVQVTDAPIKAAPGDKGNISLTINNDGEDIVEATVNVSKAMMSEPMQKRLFFYAQASQMRNGENVERVYLNSQEGYTYTIFSKGNLTLTDTVHNDAQLKWQWVYDVLGYYVLGTLRDDGSVEIREYLRPVEYDYDEARTTFKPQNGTGSVLELETVDGKTTVEEFLQNISATDGYPGTIDPASKTAGGFYKVTADEDNYGVWVYLCNYADIASETYWDTQVGEKAAAAETDPTITLDTYTARLTVSGQKSDVDVQVISTQKRLEEALSSQEDAVLQLTQDLSMDSVVVPSGKKVLLDLNQHTLTAQGAMLMDLEEGSSVMVFGGNLEGEGIIGFTTRGAELTFHNVTAQGMKRLVTVQDNYGQGADSKISLVGCDIKAQESVVHLVGNGSASQQLTQLIVENSTLEGDYAGIVGNGNSDSCGTDTTVLNSTIKGRWASIYMPQKNSTMTIMNSTLEGYTGIVLKGGYTKIVASKITGTGAFNEPAYSNNGFTDTGDGVYVEANYTAEIVVELYGDCEVTSQNALAVRKYKEDATNATIAIYGGTYSSDVSAYLGEGAQSSNGGKVVS